MVTTTVTTVMDMTTTTQTLTRPSPTSTFGISLGADLLRRLMSGNLAPYAGVGLMLDVSTQNTFWRDDITTMNQVTVRNDSSTSFGFGGRGILGVGWRVHPHFLLFAEYAVNLVFVDVTADSTSAELTVMGAPPSTAKSNSTMTRVFEFSTGLSQGAALGLVAFF